MGEGSRDTQNNAGRPPLKQRLSLVVPRRLALGHRRPVGAGRLAVGPAVPRRGSLPPGRPRLAVGVPSGALRVAAAPVPAPSIVGPRPSARRAPGHYYRAHSPKSN